MLLVLVMKTVWWLCRAPRLTLPAPISPPAPATPAPATPAPLSLLAPVTPVPLSPPAPATPASLSPSAPANEINHTILFLLKGLDEIVRDITSSAVLHSG